MCPQRKDNRMKVKDDLSIAEKIKADSLSIQHHALHISESMTSYARYNEPPSKAALEEVIETLQEISILTEGLEADIYDQDQN